MPEYKGLDYQNNPRLAACARKMDASLWPILDQINAAHGLTREQALARLVTRDSTSPGEPLADDAAKADAAP